MAGIINVAPVAQTKWDVTAPQTVQGQIADIVAKDSPQQQLAKTSALQQAAKSGLTNSSMAVGAAQDAVIKNALPIASQDAQTFAAAGQTNATEANKIGMFNTDQEGLNTRFDRELAKKDEQFNISEQNKLASQNLDIASREKLASQEIEFNKFAAASDAGKTFFDTYQKSINSILLNPDLSTTPDPNTGISPKQAALDMAAQTFQAGMTMHQGIEGLDLGSILTFDQPAGSANTVATINSAVGNTPEAKALAAKDAELAALKTQLAAASSRGRNGSAGWRRSRGD